jgi:hypothetical protein
MPIPDWHGSPSDWSDVDVDDGGKFNFAEGQAASDLAPCPWCKGTPTIVKRRSNDPYFPDQMLWEMRHDCPAISTKRSRYTREELVALWNRRSMPGPCTPATPSPTEEPHGRG